MASNKPHVYQDAQEIIDALSQHRAFIAKQFNARLARKSAVWLIKTGGVAGSTFRRFQDLRLPPSLIFRRWVGSVVIPYGLGSPRIQALLAVKDKASYDTWFDELCVSLLDAWQKDLGPSLPYGPDRKLAGLFMKSLVLWSDLKDESQRQRVISYLHVPLDKFTLRGIRKCIDTVKIPADASMGFVTDPDTYQKIQQRIAEITGQIDIPPIYFDVLAWDMVHH